MRLKRREMTAPEVNSTPLIDMVFQLLIFFLVATQVKKSEIAQLVLPVAQRSTEVKAEPGEPPLILNILQAKGENKDRPYICMNERMNLAEFKEFMKGRRAYYQEMSKEMPVLRVRADKDSEFKQIQQALIACRDVEIEKVRLTTLKRQ